MVRSDIVKRVVDRSDNWIKEGKDNAFSMSGELYPYDKLFSPITLNHTKINNRIVMAPMTNRAMCDETGKMLQYFFDRAKGGVGLIITGSVAVSHGVDPTLREKGGLTCYPRIGGSKTALMGWRDLCEGVHSFGSRIFIQLTPGLGRVGDPLCLKTRLKMPVSSSFLPNYYVPEIPCLRLSDHKLKKIIKDVAQAAADCKEVGFDGCCLEGSEGHLIEQMTNPAFNHRRIGCFRDWERFGIDMVKEIRERVGDRYPIMYKIDLSLALEEVYGERMDSDPILKRFKGGRTADMTLKYMEDLVSAGVDVFSVDLGCYENWWLAHQPMTMPGGAYLEISKFVKDYFKERDILSNQGLEVPVVAVGKLGYPDIAERALRDGECDMVMLGRPLLADPDWPKKAYRGDVKSIRPCIGCQEGCLNESIQGGHIQCAVNPRTSFEHVFSEIPSRASKRKRIAVVGSGPAGVEFAVTGDRRGHSVTLFEKTGDIGGSAKYGSVPKFKFDLRNYLCFMKEELKNSGVIVRLNTTVDIPTIKDSYDVVVFANGSVDIVPDIHGLDSARTVSPQAILNGKETIDPSSRIVILGGGRVSAEVALYLSAEKGARDVTLIEAANYIMRDVSPPNRSHMIHLLEKNGVKICISSRVEEIRDGNIVIRQKTGNAFDPYNTWKPILPNNVHNPFEKRVGKGEEEKEIPYDLIVLSYGSRANDELYFRAVKEHAAPEIYRIGDSFESGRILEATRSAYRLALRV